MRSKKVVFFFPAFSSQEATAPLAILAISTPLLRAGYQVRIIDSTITPNFQKQVLKELENALCLAVSLVTGPMIRETVQIARAAKALYPGLPVILGGWHPSLLPDQTLAAEFIDVVVRGQGEDALLEILERLEAGASLEGVAGVGYKQDGRLIFNPPRPLKPIRDLPPKAYHLADFDAYERLCGRRWAMYISSLACPYSCSYCTNQGVYGRQWNALDAGQAAQEMSDLVSRYRLSLLWVVDDNFLVDRERAVAIAEELLRRGVKFDWSIQASTNLVTRLTTEELKLLRRAGLSQVSQGADSGSPKILHLMNKDFQKIETVYEAAHKLHEVGIRPSFNMIFGYPGEGEKERRESIALIMDICRRFPGAEFWTNIFTPYPGSPVMERAFELGIDVPKSLEGWADFFPRYTVLPWLKGRKHHRLQIMREYLRVAFHRVPIAADRRNRVTRAVHEAISVPARWRLDHDFYVFPFELWLKNAAARVLQAPKPKVDARQLSAEPVTC
ncbi:MAG TPA: radical SAM protein [Bryobacterales bacterium]|jgi:anaerobic magnesium-protoporphyrin IX monomethyl ester cyclase|nr:radical SAM protein [Bryobacterales bacterium]